MPGPVETRLTEERKAAMKGGDKHRLGVLRLLINDLKNETDKKGDLGEEQEIEVLRRASKQRKDAIEQAEAGGRSDIAEAEKAELRILEEFLPSLMGEVEVKAKELLAELGIESRKEQGRFMKEWMSRYRASSDGKTVNQVLARLLG